MPLPIFYTPCRSPIMEQSVRSLKENGISFSPVPSMEVTHLLLSTPAFAPDGTLKGSCDTLPSVLQALPEDITVLGGKLDTPLLQSYRVTDLLCDPLYLAENADITAHCALKLAAGKLPVTLKGCPVLVIGWGRIGKCLARLLKQLDAEVTVAARKPETRAMLRTLGYRDAPIGTDLSGFRVIFNTADACVVPHAPENCLNIDLASVKGIYGENVIWARGLPGSLAPETGGKLIAGTILRLL